VFTARYALSPYIKQIRFVFKGLILEKVSHCVEPVTLIFRSKPCCMVYDRGDGKVVSDVYVFCTDLRTNSNFCLIRH
jgi:hypothetical protein